MTAPGPKSIAGSPSQRALLFLCLLGAALPIAGASRLEASLGFGGYAPPDRWVPLWIRAEGLPRSASIQVLRRSASGESLGVETFPALDGVRLECPAWTSGETDALTVRLLSEGRALAELGLETRAKPFPGHLVLACGLSARARLAIASALLPLEPVLAIPTSPADLPSNGLDYDAVSAIAIADDEVEFSPAQRGAILAWLSGGGRLCALSGSESGGALASLGLAAQAGGATAAYGLGGYASIPSERAELAGAWRDALALAPYDPSQRLGAGSVARGGESDAGAESPSRGAWPLIVAAIATWLAATLLAAFFARGRAAPLAIASALCLAAVLAGGRALDRTLIRGASVRAIALVLPESGAAFLSLKARAYVPPSSLSWAASRAIGKPSLSYTDAESGSFGEWKHSMATVFFGLRSASADSLELEAMLEPELWKEISSGSSSAFVGAAGARPRSASTSGASANGASTSGAARGGATEPPDVESSSRLAYLGSGANASWWDKEPGARWEKLEAPPAWLEADAQALSALAGGSRSVPILAGSCPASALALGAEGGRLREIRWAMPLPKAGEP